MIQLVSSTWQRHEPISKGYLSHMLADASPGQLTTTARFNRWFIPATGSTAAAMGVLVVWRPGIGLGVAIAIPALALLVSHPTVRLVAVVIGALLVFQSPSDPPKYAYLGLAILCCALSAVRLIRNPDDVAMCFRPLLLATLPAAGLLIISLPAALSIGTPISAWAHDVLSYVLLIALPIVGLDAGRALSPRHLDWALAALGVFAAFGFALDWLNRRGVSSLGVGRLILATTVLPALVFIFAVVKAAHGQTVRWLLVATFIAALLLVTGTRTNVVLVLGIFGILGARRNGAVPPLRALMYLASVVGLVIALLPILASQITSNPDFLHERLQIALSTLHGGATDDQSYLERMHSYQVSRESFNHHPWLGTGPGYTIGGLATTLDSPWVVPSKLGIIGTSALVAWLGALAVSLRRTGRLAGPAPILVAARGWALILAALTPFGPWLEDKGVALSITMLVAAAAATSMG